METKRKPGRPKTLTKRKERNHYACEYTKAFLQTIKTIKIWWYEHQKDGMTEKDFEDLIEISIYKTNKYKVLNRTEKAFIEGMLYSINPKRQTKMSLGKAWNTE